jgi:hypothetical protein
MLNRVRRPGTTGSEGEKATNSPRSTQPAQRFRFDAQTLARRAQPPTGKQLGFGNHSRPKGDLQAAARVPVRLELAVTLSRIFPADGRIRPQTRITKHSE